MKHKKTGGLLLLFLILTLAIGAVAYAAGAGTSEDPLATKSYVDSAIADVKTYVDGKGNGTAAESNYAVFSLAAGKTIIADKGAEIILRSGKATIISSQNGGLADTTAGADLPDGADMPLNHLLIVPGSDHRGFVTTTDVWVMIKGGYTLE